MNQITIKLDATVPMREGTILKADVYRPAEDTRGRFASDGEWLPFAHEHADGYDTVQWAATPESNGKVGMFEVYELIQTIYGKHSLEYGPGSRHALAFTLTFPDHERVSLPSGARPRTDVHPRQSAGRGARWEWKRRTELGDEECRSRPRVSAMRKVRGPIGIVSHQKLRRGPSPHYRIIQQRSQ